MCSRLLSLSHSRTRTRTAALFTVCFRCRRRRRSSKLHILAIGDHRYIFIIRYIHIETIVSALCCSLSLSIPCALFSYSIILFLDAYIRAHNHTAAVCSSHLLVVFVASSSFCVVALFVAFTFSLSLSRARLRSRSSSSFWSRSAVLIHVFNLCAALVLASAGLSKRAQVSENERESKRDRKTQRARESMQEFDWLPGNHI